MGGPPKALTGRVSVSTTAIALAASAVLCAAMTTSVVVRAPGPVVVVEERLEPPAGTYECSEEHYSALRDAWSRLARVEADLRDRYAHDPRVWPQVHRQLDAVAHYQDEIRFVFQRCHDLAIEPDPPSPRAGCG